MRVSQAYDKQVYTEDGIYLGKVEEALIQDNSRIYGWQVRLENPKIKEALRGKGIIVPHTLVRAIGDIMIIARVSIKKEE